MILVKCSSCTDDLDVVDRRHRQIELDKSNCKSSGWNVGDPEIEIPEKVVSVYLMSYLNA